MTGREQYAPQWVVPIVVPTRIVESSHIHCRLSLQDVASDPRCIMTECTEASAIQLPFNTIINTEIAIDSL